MTETIIASIAFVAFATLVAFWALLPGRVSQTSEDA